MAWLMCGYPVIGPLRAQVTATFSQHGARARMAGISGVVAGIAAGQTLTTGRQDAERDTVHRGIAERASAESVVAWYDGCCGQRA